MRYSASKVRVIDLIRGIFKPGNKDSKEPSFLITPFNQRIVRVNIVGTVLEKFISEANNYGFLTVNDLTESIRVKFFNEDVELIKDINVGDIVTVVGKVKEYFGEIYISGEAVRKSNIDIEVKRKMEVIENFKNLKIEKKEETNLENYKQIVLRLIRELDDGNGVEVSKILEISKIDVRILDEIISNLIEEGKIEEILPAVYKIK